MMIVGAKDDFESAIEQIRHWSGKDQKLVVVIDGFSGSGKSRLLQKLVECDRSIIGLSLDDFVYDYPHRKACVRSSASPEDQLVQCWFRWDELIELIKAFRSGRREATISIYDFDKNRIASGRKINLVANVLIVEGVFTIGAFRARGLADRSILILSDAEEADARRIEREKNRWGNRFQPDNHPESFVNLFKKAFARYLMKEAPFEKADLVVLN